MSIQIIVTFFFYFHGFCSDVNCGVSIYGECSSNFNVNSKTVDIAISTFDARHIRHKRKRRLKDENRKKAAKKLRHVKAVQYKKERAVQIIDFQDQEPPDLHNTGTYRNLRLISGDANMGFEGPEDVIESLLFYKKRGTHGIRMVVPFYFSVTYYLDEQLQFWNEIN